ncbi:MAG: ankyrin repeat domain-containing protein [Micavibrio sp.]|nr:ankyrin repeat domain-containing protein [Micavibrio sp.]
MPYKQRHELEEDLHYAAVTNQLWRAHFLLTEKNVDATTRENFCMRWAANGGHVDMLLLLHKHGADVNAKNGEPLLRAINGKRMETVEALLSLGADISLNNHAALRAADAAKDDKMLRRLLHQGQDVRRVAEELLQKARERHDTSGAAIYLDYLTAERKKGLKPPSL